MLESGGAEVVFSQYNPLSKDEGVQPATLQVVPERKATVLQAQAFVELAMLPCDHVSTGSTSVPNTLP